MRPVALRVFGLCAVVLLCAACASTPEATPERDAEAKRFEPVTRDAVIYVYRDDSWGTGGTTTLFADDRIVGASLPGTYFRIIALPGRTVIRALPPDMGQIDVETRGNDVVFIEMRTIGGDGPPSSRFRRMPPELAKAAIQERGWMLETWRPNQPRLFW